MITITDEVLVRADLLVVFDCIWDATCWPRLTTHVKRIEMLESEKCQQRFLMTIESNGKEHTVESFREAEPGRCIRYRQIRPPIFLKEHTGEWQFVPVADGVRVDLTHCAIIDYEKALPAFAASSPAEAEEVVSNALKVNGSKTLLAIKRHLEQGPTEGFPVASTTQG